MAALLSICILPGSALVLMGIVTKVALWQEACRILRWEITRPVTAARLRSLVWRGSAVSTAVTGRWLQQLSQQLAIVQRVLVVWIEGERLIIGGDRFLILAETRQGIATVIVICSRSETAERLQCARKVARAIACSGPPTRILELLCRATRIAVGECRRALLIRTPPQVLPFPCRGRPRQRQHGDEQDGKNTAP